MYRQDATAPVEHLEILAPLDGIETRRRASAKPALNRIVVTVFQAIPRFEVVVEVTEQFRNHDGPLLLGLRLHIVDRNVGDQLRLVLNGDLRRSGGRKEDERERRENEFQHFAVSLCLNRLESKGFLTLLRLIIHLFKYIVNSSLKAYKQALLAGLFRQDYKGQSRRKESKLDLI